MTRDVAAVVVTYNRLELLKRNIARLRAQTAAENLEIYIVDNHSTDGTGAYLAPLAQSGVLHYADTGANLGGAGGFQYGVRLAAASGCRYLWLMDDDCMPEPTTLQALLDAAEQLTPFGFLSSKVLWTDGGLCRMNIQRQTLTRPVSCLEGGPVPVVMASFVSLFVPVSVIEAVGLPIREFFIWTDDWEYTRRISRRYPCWAVPASVVVHETARNEGASIATDSEDRLARYGYIYRNDVVLYRREGLRGWLYLLVRNAVHLLRVLLKARSGRMKRIALILRGTWAGLRFRPAIEYLDTKPETAENPEADREQ